MDWTKASSDNLRSKPCYPMPERRPYTESSKRVYRRRRKLTKVESLYFNAAYEIINFTVR